MRVVVSVASKHGGTAEIGEVIVRQMTDNPAVESVASVAPEQISTLEPYDVVVLGGAIYAEEWLPQMVALTERFGDQLRGKIVHMFASGPMGAVKPDTVVPAQIAGIGERIGARSVRIFGGKVDRGVLGSVERTVMRMKGAPDGDWRDLSDAKYWADEIVEDAKTLR